MTEAAPVIAPELFRQIKGIQIRTQRLVTDLLAGEYESAFKGRGMEFEDVRAYQPGDDVRHIDWNVTARTGGVFVKNHREERELTVMLLVDVSSSGSFGSVAKSKNEVAAEMAALLAYTAIKSNDRVGLIIFTDEVEHFIPPKKGRAHVWRVIREILSFQPTRKGTNLPRALEFLGKVLRRRAVVFLLSDFLDDQKRGDSPLSAEVNSADSPRFDDQIRVVSKRHDLTAIQIGDPREEELPAIGFLELEDAETGETVLVDTADARVRQLFARNRSRHNTQVSRSFRHAAVGEIRLQSDKPIIDPLVRYFRQREKARR